MRVFRITIVYQDANDGLYAYIRVDRLVVNAFGVLVIALCPVINTSFDKLRIIYGGLVGAIEPERALYTIRVRIGWMPSFNINNECRLYKCLNQ